MAVHQDNFSNKTRHSKQERVDTFTTLNSGATEEIVISHPWSPDKIEQLKPLLVAMARENWAKFEDDESAGEQCIDAIFDEALCDVTEFALESNDFDQNIDDLHKLRALMIQVARDLHFEEVAQHVSQYSGDNLKQYGLRYAYEKSTYRKTAKALKKDDKYASLVEACFVAVHALFWNGVPIPEGVKDKYDLSYDAGPAASDFPEPARQLALYNLVEDLIQIVVENLDLQRGNNKSRDLRTLLGIFAYAAHHERSIEDYHQSAQHSFDLSSAFSATTIRDHIDDLNRWKVGDMFDDINQALLEYIIESGVVSRPLMISYDLTDIQSLGLSEYESRFLTEDGRWRFASLSFTDPAIEYSFGLRLLKSEAPRARELENFLRDLTSMVEVELFMADRGFDGAEDIKACRKFVPGHWVICAQDDSDPQGQSSDFSRLRAELEPGKTAVRPSAGYANLKPPVKLIGYSGADEDDESPGPIRAFYSGISLPDDEDEREEEITKINFRYNQRAKIETMFRMAKNQFDLSTDTDKSIRKAFYFQMSVLLYNLYKIVQTVPAPRSGVELDTTPSELLEVVQNLAFDGPTASDALTYHREHY